MSQIKYSIFSVSNSAVPFRISQTKYEPVSTLKHLSVIVKSKVKMPDHVGPFFFFYVLFYYLVIITYVLN